MSADLQRMYLGHLSGDCNRPEIAFGVVSERLQRIGAAHVAVATASQDTPSQTLQLGAVPGLQPVPTDHSITVRAAV